MQRLFGSALLFSTLLVTAGLWLATCGSDLAVRAETAGGPGVNSHVDFVRDVQPIFMDNCYRCHGEKVHRAGLRLDKRSTALRIKDAIIIPGNSLGSRLMELATEKEAGEVMPPEGDR